jgi:hypothetical protein
VAPKHVAVVREEMQRAVEDANRRAAASTLAESDTNEVSVVTELAVGGFSSSSAAGTRS